MSDLNERLRAEFEAWAEAEFYTTRDESGDYINLLTRCAWDGFKAARRAPAAAPAPVAAIKTWHDRLGGYPDAQTPGSKREASMVAEIADLRAALAAAPAAAPIVQPVGDETAPLYDLSADKDFAEDFARLAEGIPRVKTRKLVIKAVKQAIAAHGVAERERGRREARAALAAPVVQAEPVHEWDLMVERIRQRHAFRYEGISTPNEARMADLEHLLKYISASAARTTSAADAKDAAPDCRNEGGFCACRSGGSFGGCAKERAAIATSADEVKHG